LSLDSVESLESSLLLLLSPDEESSSSVDEDVSCTSLSEVARAGLIGALFDVDVRSSLLLLLLLDTDGEDGSLSVLSRAGLVGVEVLPSGGSCQGRSVEVTFCASTEFWLVVSTIVDNSRTTVSTPNLTCCWKLIISFLKQLTDYKSYFD
jgi:hypothetical protein